MFAITQNITNATLCVVLCSMLTNIVELIELLFLFVSIMLQAVCKLRRCNLKYQEKSGNLMQTGKWPPCRLNYTINFLLYS